MVAIVAFVVWATVAGLLNGRLPRLDSPYFYAPLLVAGGVAVGRWTASRLTATTVVPALVLLTTAFAIATTGRTADAPLGYSNANAALAAQVLAMCGVVAVGARGTPRLVAALASLVSLATLIACWSRAGLVVSVPLVLAVGLALAGWVRRRWWPPVLGSLTLISGAAALVALATRTEWPSLAVAAFSSARQRLWADALALWQQQPVVGSGPGAFREFSPLAVDADTETAHSSVLQIAAETGLIGVALFGVLIAAGYALAIRGKPAQALIASGAWTVLCLHSFIDHLLEFALLVAATGIVLGTAAVSSSREVE